MDKHYTPREFAGSIIRGLAWEEPETAADFAAGSGSLLAAILDRWPNCQLTATDLDPVAIRRLRQRFKPLSAGICDFLDPRSHERTEALIKARGNVSLVFINPPFSCRGAIKHQLTHDGISFKCSRAMAFLFFALQYLRSDGLLVALLPASCLTSEKDSTIISMLSKTHTIETLGGVRSIRFRSCEVSVSIVAITRSRNVLRGGSSAPNNVSDLFARSPIRANVFRGKLSMPLVRRVKQGVPLVHTTNLQLGGIEWSGITVSMDLSPVYGPAVLIPRVGRPNENKLCLYSRPEVIAISDCIMAVQGRDLDETALIYKLIKAQWNWLRQGYVGTCAQYITLARLKALLQCLGIICLKSTADANQREAA